MMMPKATETVIIYILVVCAWFSMQNETVVQPVRLLKGNCHE